jgi:hypothetical protein
MLFLDEQRKVNSHCFSVYTYSFVGRIPSLVPGAYPHDAQNGNSVPRVSIGRPHRARCFRSPIGSDACRCVTRVSTIQSGHGWNEACTCRWATGGVPAGHVYKDRRDFGSHASGVTYRCGSGQEAARLRNLPSEPLNRTWSCDVCDGS